MRILLVEDEPDLGEALKKALNQKKYIVDWVQDGTEAWNCLDSQWTEYNLAIIDWLLPGMSGIELIKRLRARQNSLPVLMLTAKDQMEDKVIGLDAGADDYLVKPFGMAELLARLRALGRRSPQLVPQQLQRGDLILDYGTRTVFYQGNQTLSLTTKEFLLLEYFFNHPNQILTSEQIRNQLWEMGEEPMSNVVAAQVRLLRRKLETVDCKNVIETVHGVGYRFNLNL
ncbi:two component transcriptional regulator, winged helix family [Gloeothece citriformis PCC 7424]|uniref:Two component transcriptional regulator, winged helix family n=1 Tax=Gloeothece citriformis (strain PCC 7424) TaxID=65393 RepID=B7K725_GLOC7|nr:two-component system response regulator RppA [Gloeothece citriformis]ACK69593.1 two component transcriptional regulator, winged helix family [Gloeothece citriformis PCC 7424]